MPKIKVNGAEIYYEDTGDKNKPTIVFSHGLLWSTRMFDKQRDALKDKYRIIAYDHRGQGQTPVADSGYDMETLYQDCIALIETLNVKPVHFVGLSMGGFMGLRVAARRPDLLRSLVIMESSADPEPEENLSKYKMMGFAARWIGLWSVANATMKIMFSESYRSDPKNSEEFKLWRNYLLQNDRIGITRALNGVVTRKGVYDELDKITIPTLIVVGEEDTATVPAKSERMHAKIKKSKLVYIPKAGHTSSVENGEAVNKELKAFFASLS
jgi:3-oxoadipate enol-lactonase